MWGNRQERISRRRLKSLVRYLPPDSMTLLLARRGPSRMSEPEQVRRRGSAADIVAKANQAGHIVGVHHG